MFRILKRIVIVYNPNLYARKIGVNLGDNVKFYGKHPDTFGSEPWLVTLGDNVHVVSGCRFITHDGGVLILRDKFPKLEITKPILIGNNVYIGINCIILPGVIIGSGSIVSKNIPSNSVAAGIPAKIIKSLDQYTEKVLSESLELGDLNADEKAIEIKKYYNLI